MKSLRLGISGLMSVMALTLLVAVIQLGGWTMSGALASPAAATCTWNGSSGNWSDSTKWSCGLVPGAADTAIVNSGVITVDTPSTIGTLLFSGTFTTSITGAQPITIATSMTWTGASRLRGIGLTTIDTNATLVISHNVGTTAAFERPILNKGTVNMVHTGLYAPSVPTTGFFTNTNTGLVNVGGYGILKPYKFINYGMVRNSDNNVTPGLGGGEILTDFSFENYGSISAENGNLNLGALIYNYAGGAITLADGNLLCYNEFTGQVNGTILLNAGTLSGTGAVECSVSNSGGLVTPGAAAGVLLIGGTYTQQAGGALDIKIGGPDLKGYTALIVDGAASLNGTLNISLINGYTPALFDGFAIVRYTTHSGTFATVVNPIAATHPLNYSALQAALGSPQRNFQSGDIFVGVGRGQIKEYDLDGNLVAVLDSTTDSQETAGMCFDADGNLFATMFQAQKVSKFSNAGALISSTFGTGYPAQPESCVVDTAGNIYVGQAGFFTGGALQKRDANGALLANYTMNFEDRGADWIDLAADQRTLLYTSEGPSILAYDVVTPAQESDFITGLAEPCYAARIRQNGEVLTACSSAVYRVSPTGTVMMSYTAANLGEVPPNPEQGLFAMTLDSDGTSFWTAGYFSGKVHKVDIATGTELQSFNASPFTTIAGLTVYGEIQVGRPGLALIETVGTDPTACAPTREITIPTTTTVTYCYRAINTGSITLTTHTLTDTVLGNIFTNNAITLAPGASTFVTRSATLNTTTLNVATWNATDGASKHVTTSDFTRVNGPGTGVPPLDKIVYLPLIRR